MPKIQHRRSISLKRAIFEALRIYHAEQIKPHEGQSFTAWINETLSGVVGPTYRQRGEALAEAIVTTARSQQARGEHGD